MQDQPNGASTDRATHTFADIERREEEIREAERNALRQLVGVLRELAVNLPVESKLARRFASGAKTLETFSKDNWITSAGFMFRGVIKDIQEDAVERVYVQLLAVLEDGWPAIRGTVDESALEEVRRGVEMRLESL